MRVCVLASGSKGNVTYIEGEKTKILIDAGLSCNDLERKLCSIGVRPHEIDSILITHEHSDHIKGLNNFAKNHNCKVFAHPDVWTAMSGKVKDLNLSQCVEIFSHNFYINELDITNFDLSHDSSHCLGYSVTSAGQKVTLATDLGFTNDIILSNFINSSLLILEANHDIDTLTHNPKYPERLKRRILSKNGHLSNVDTANALLQVLGKGVRAVIMAHLSEENNSPELAQKTVRQILTEKGANVDQEIYLDVAHQHRIGNIFKIKE